MARLSGVVIGSHMVDVVGDGHLLGIAWLQEAGLCKARQGLRRLAQLSLRRAVVDLDNLLALIIARIRHIYGDFNLAVHFFHGGGFHGEVGIGEAKTEGIQHLIRRKRLKVAVSHIDVLNIVVVLIFAEVPGGRIILVRHGNGIAQLAGGRDIAADNVCGRLAALHAAVPNVHDGLDAVLFHPAHVDDVADIQQNRHMVKLAGDFLNQVALIVGQEEASFRVAGVFALARGAAEHDDCLIGLGSCICDQLFAHGHFRLAPWLGPVPDSHRRVLRNPVLIDFRQVLVDMDLRIFAETVENVRHMIDVYLAAGTGAALEIVDLNASEHRNRFIWLHRQGLVLVLQQDRALRSRLPG